MTIEEAYTVLSDLVTSDEQEKALNLLVNTAVKANQATSKQYNFALTLAQAVDKTLAEVLDEVGIEHDENVRTITKKDASKVINYLKEQGAMEHLSYD